MTFSHKCYLPVTKKGEKLLNCSLCSPKTTFLAIFANFGQLWMVVYTAIGQFLEIFSIICWVCIGVTYKVKNFEINPIFAKKVIKKN